MKQIDCLERHISPGCQMWFSLLSQMIKQVMQRAFMLFLVHWPLLEDGNSISFFVILYVLFTNLISALLYHLYELRYPWCFLQCILFSVFKDFVKCFLLHSGLLLCSGVEKGFKGKVYPRFVKMILSATLTQDPSKISQLDLHHPLLLTSGDKRYKLPKRLESFKLVFTLQRFMTR